MFDVLFINPYTDKIESMPIEMIGAYLPYGSHLKLEEAARVAVIKDDEAAANLALSAIEITYPETIVFGELDARNFVEAPSLR